MLARRAVHVCARRGALRCVSAPRPVLRRWSTSEPPASGVVGGAASAAAADDNDGWFWVPPKRKDRSVKGKHRVEKVTPSNEEFDRIKAEQRGDSDASDADFGEAIPAEEQVDNRLSFNKVFEKSATFDADTVCLALEEEGALDVDWLKLEESGLTDKMVFASAKSFSHARSLCETIVTELKRRKIGTWGAVEGFESDDWILIKCRGFVVHIFTMEKRAELALEAHWDPKKQKARALRDWAESKPIAMHGRRKRVPKGMSKTRLIARKDANALEAEKAKVLRELNNPTPPLALESGGAPPR
ncbi:Oligomerization domain-containing protein [Pelagophyceae sp. CCMP2097]|nr:Oligomerization domain-containing protein [Pelagophyceae sp. CCMP2097]|mmetsp:Transcript_26000/g.87392  ORF Transcript_26000/g.87392 Transcript_26000/m.87392 type:complete len:301 (+) Transcript_26000:52-954(+)